MNHSGKLVINRRGMLTSTAATAAAAALSSFGQNVLNVELLQTATLVEATLEGRIEADGNGPKLVEQSVRFKVMGIDVAFPFKSLTPYIPEFFPYPVREPGDPLPPTPPARHAGAGPKYCRQNSYAFPDMERAFCVPLSQSGARRHAYDVQL